MDPSVASGELVLTLGAGKAAAMHARIWHDNLGLDVVAYDVLSPRLDPEKMQDDLRKLHDLGSVSVTSSLDGIRPFILDITTTSGTHTDALMGIYEAYGEAGFAPRAVLLEKPLDKLSELRAWLDASSLTDDMVFVNENYNASIALRDARKIASQQTNQGNPVTGIFVNFDKNRVPDVQNGRFTDPILGAYGIEMPHMLAVALHMAGTSPNDVLSVEANDYAKDVDGIPDSEYTYTRLKNQNGTEIVLAQGLGPFRLNEDGITTSYDFAPGEAVRYITTRFKDGRELRVDFAPVPKAKNYFSRLRWTNDNGRPVDFLVEDNTLRTVLRGVDSYARTGIRDPDTRGLSVNSAIRNTSRLAELRESAVMLHAA